MRIRNAFLTGAAVVGLAMSFAAPGYAAAYLKLGDIKGEALDSTPSSGAKHKGENDVLAWSWGSAVGTSDKDHKKWIDIQSMSTPMAAQGRPKSSAQGTLRLRGHLDKSSTKLQEACANGTYFDEIEIAIPTNDKREPYLKYKLERVFVTSYSISRPPATTQPPTEEVMFSYHKATEVADTAGRATGGVAVKPMRAKPARDYNSSRSNNIE